MAISNAFIVESWLAKTRLALIDNYDRMGLRASGSYAESLEPYYNFKAGSLKVGMLAAQHSIYMEQGTGPQTDPSPEKAKKLYPAILQWIEDKGLGFDNQRAFRIALSIVYNGITVPNAYNSGDVVSSVVTRTRINELIRELGIARVEQTKSDVIQIFKS